ncbi:DUF7310 family coiled-coil domain-containing protein [Halomarina ordinaria]|uniref:DUF7310 domain-containing protein n=1 Tax=Halomarina ordinaria TaxID=3033939 RepID=A0ABD5UAG4_9EURY|nr:hypothetical protein [Halomarina sp. PSRA2]
MDPNSKADALVARVDALERALTDGRDLPDLAPEADRAARLAAVETRLDDLDDRLADVEAATRAVRGYVGQVRHADREVERRADAALAAVEELEATLDGAGTDAPLASADATTPAASLATPVTDDDRPDPAVTDGGGARDDADRGIVARLRDALS